MRPLPNHTKPDMLLLFKLWHEGTDTKDIAAQFGVSVSTVCKWASQYKLPRRLHWSQTDAPAPSPEDDAASLAGLGLSPWVAERARECRERHYAERRAEPEIVAAAKARAWRRGDYQPKGAHHDRV